MKILGLLLAATIATAACHREDEKGEATTTTTRTTTSARDANTAVVVPDTMAAYEDARRLSARLAEDLKLTDATVVKRIEKTYYTRGRRLNELQTRYANDTTGRYAAVRQANDQADEEVRATLNNPVAYNTYSANRASYGEGPYSLPPARVEPLAMPVRAAPVARRVGEGSAIKKLERKTDGDRKTKYENGAKVKVSDDGSRKIRLADGTKIKIDKNGKRTVKKF